MSLRAIFENMYSKSRPTLGVLMLGVFAIACNGVAPKNGAEQSKAAAKPQKIKDDDVIASGKGGDSADLIDDNASEVFTIFCEKAAQTEAIQKNLSDYFEYFCVDGTPTKFLTTTLVESAYEGVGDPIIKKIKDWHDDPKARLTTGFVGVGIKLPISIQEHFEKLAPLAGNEATIQATAEAFGGISEISKVLKTHSNDGEYHVRGWTIEQRASKKLEAIDKTVATHTISRMDHYELEKGSVYLYTQYVTESKETIKDMMMLTAGIQIGNDSYLLTISRVVLMNQGFHPLAVEAIKTGATGLSKLNYDAAVMDE